MMVIKMTMDLLFVTTILVIVVRFLFLFTVMLIYLLGNINQVRLKQNFRVVIAHGATIVMVVRMMNACHRLEVIVKVLRLLQSHVSLRHYLVSLSDYLM